jgi:hypothetical protein
MSPKRENFAEAKAAGLPDRTPRPIMRSLGRLGWQ